MSSRIARRDFLQASTAAAGNEKPVRIGSVRVGGRGTGLLRNLLTLPGVQVPAVCDISLALEALALASGGDAHCP